MKRMRFSAESVAFDVSKGSRPNDSIEQLIYPVIVSLFRLFISSKYFTSEKSQCFLHESWYLFRLCGCIRRVFIPSQLHSLQHQLKIFGIRMLLCTVSQIRDDIMRQEKTEIKRRWPNKSKLTINYLDKYLDNNFRWVLKTVPLLMPP